MNENLGERLGHGVSPGGNDVRPLQGRGVISVLVSVGFTHGYLMFPAFGLVC